MNNEFLQHLQTEWILLNSYPLGILDKIVSHDKKKKKNLRSFSVYTIESLDFKKVLVLHCEDKSQTTAPGDGVSS